jgi:hypothetical protein
VSQGVSSIFASTLLSKEIQQQKKTGRLGGCQFGTGLEMKLPHEWEEITSRGGKKFFYNRKSGVSQWEEPDSDRADKVAVARPLTAPPERRIPGSKPKSYSENTFPFPFPFPFPFSPSPSPPSPLATPSFLPLLIRLSSCL